MSGSEQYSRMPWGSVFLIISVTLVSVASAIGGCERKEKVLDIQAPGFNLEVNKTTAPNGDRGVEFKSSDNHKIEIDAKQKRSSVDH
jgi:hypothetical protein